MPMLYCHLMNRRDNDSQMSRLPVCQARPEQIPVRSYHSIWVWPGELSRSQRKPVTMATAPDQKWDAHAGSRPVPSRDSRSSSIMPTRNVNGCTTAHQTLENWTRHSTKQLLEAGP